MTAAYEPPLDECLTEARRLLLDVAFWVVYRRTIMNARLVTSHHEYMVPQVRELAPPAIASSPTAAETRRALSQRDLVAASLLACPDRSAPAPKHGI
jgi:hypothetical protein